MRSVEATLSSAILALYVASHVPLLHLLPRPGSLAQELQT